MGLLSLGTPLSWEETKRYADHVRHHGIKQFIDLYHRLKDRTNDSLYFGDEVEYHLVKFFPAEKKVRLNLKAQHYLEKLRKQQGDYTECDWSHEYASYMIEGMPGKPYGALSGHFNTVEDNMRKRREQVLATLESSDESLLAITVFPRIGCVPFTDPPHMPQPQTSVSRSLFYPDEAINQGHPRFPTLTGNIRERRGEKVAINVPIYVDVNTPVPFTEDLASLNPEESPGKIKGAMRSNHIYMDAMGFGMGCACLQMTFQACNIIEARHLYDQLTPLTPIMMALSAASPIFRGYLADVDHRWSVIAASVDDRTREERGVIPLKDDKFVIGKSRYDSIDCYISEEGGKYNDENLVYDEGVFNTLIDGGIDDLLAKHLAHLFIRDPISLFSEKVLVTDEFDTDHFENIQSTNWQTMRFKPPPPNSKIGWRVEFRPTECQLTDFENAALTVFVVMMTRVILSYNLNLLVPIMKVDENIHRAQLRNAVLDQKFFFRPDLTTHRSPPEASECMRNSENKDNPGDSGARKSDQKPCSVAPQEMTINEIINGKSGGFTGLIPFINDYMDNIEVDVDTRCTITQYLDLIKMRASGELMTTATYMREFVKNHPSYKKDSVVSDEIAFDLMKRADHISKGLATCPELLPPAKTKSYSDIPQATLNREARKRKKLHREGDSRRGTSPLRDTSPRKGTMRSLP